MIITIDGPAASGKSTAAYLLAKKLGFYYLNSGLLFRALAYLLTTYAGYEVNELRDAHAKDIVTYLDSRRLNYWCDSNATPHVSFDGADITALLKTESVDTGSSIIGTNVAAREQLLKLQRELAAQHNVIAEGRDSGTAVFPHAEIKFFLTAPLEVRAQRLVRMHKNRGISMINSEAQQLLAERDERDMNRPVTPLVVAPGAFVIDNGMITIQETIDALAEHVQKNSGSLI